ncbi:polyprenyl synthetase family protein [Rhodoluna lacicola]|uniref:Geranylgeranyl pyrophosphate synthase n=1 Tax=Rhodoluna lacicola TaxID=529884 RepID=A0A060JEN6_9MICO|nr:polyprenyl synthetase family protein [Rhodoluna lacicola]AIC47042.1 Geranylgeranyl pyrophosphate synthase [Rhodoluna lacicola]
MSPISLPRQLKKVSDRALLKSLEAGLEIVEENLKQATSHADKIAGASARHLVDAGGKRVRPTLVLLSAQLGDAKNQDIIDAAVVVELTHLATLYHDDVMDDAPTRRGVPTAQMIWGNSIAILTGDLLFARASQVGSRLGEESLILQADTFERLCLGQLHETIGPNESEDPIAHYIQVMADKTGSLIAAAARLGIMLSGAPREYLEPMGAYGEKVGVAFQLIDDVIDISAAGPSGKTPGTDLRAGVPTLPVLLLRKAAAAGDTEAVSLLALIDGGLEDDARLQEALVRLRNHPVAEQAYLEAKRWADDAVASISVLPDGPVKNALALFAQAVVDRNN